MKAVDLMENEQSEKAIALLESYLLNADDEKKYTIAEFYSQWGFYEEAIIILKELLVRYPAESDIKVMLADIYIGLENDKSAIDLLADIKADDPVYIQALLQMADLYQAQGLFEVAELKLLEAKKLSPTEPIIDFALAEFFFSIGDYKRSIIYYERLFPKTKELADIRIDIRLAEAYAASGEYEIALGYFQEIDSNNPDILFKHGFTAYHAKRRDIAINIWKKVLELDEHYYTVYYELAKAYREEDLLDDAYAICKKGLQFDEYNKELYYYAGLLAYQLDDATESEKLIREAIALDPDYKEAILFMIELFKKTEDSLKIIDLILEIKELGADDPLYEWELARAYITEESYQKAFDSYEIAYNNFTEDSEFLKEYGYFLIEEGKLPDAILMFQAYLKIEPSDAEVESYLNRLQQND